MFKGPHTLTRSCEVFTNITVATVKSNASTLLSCSDNYYKHTVSPLPIGQNSHQIAVNIIKLTNMKKIIEQSLKCEVVSRSISSLPVIKHLVTRRKISIVTVNRDHTCNYKKKVRKQGCSPMPAGILLGIIQSRQDEFGIKHKLLAENLLAIMLCIHITQLYKRRLQCILLKIKE